MNQRVIIVPDLNRNADIEAAANTAGAYAGAAVSAVVGGIGTMLNGLFRGAVAGAQVTYQNAGDHQLPIVNTSHGHRNQLPAVAGAPAQRQFVLTVAPPTNQGQTLELSEQELDLIRKMRSGELTLSQ